MKSAVVVLLCAALPSLALAGPDDDFARGYALANEKGCFECHALGHTEVGPAFRAIARRYRFDAQAPERLPYVIRGGSVGHWGERYVMWPQPRLSDDEVRQLVAWVLSQ